MRQLYARVGYIPQLETKNLASANCTAEANCAYEIGFKLTFTMTVLTPLLWQYRNVCSLYILEVHSVNLTMPGYPYKSNIRSLVYTL